MPTVRIRYRLVGKHEQIQGMDPWGHPVIRYPIQLESVDVVQEKAAFDQMEVGKEYFADFTLVEEGWLTKQEQPPKEDKKE